MAKKAAKKKSPKKKAKKTLKKSLKKKKSPAKKANKASKKVAAKKKTKAPKKAAKKLSKKKAPTPKKSSVAKAPKTQASPTERFQGPSVPAMTLMNQDSQPVDLSEVVQAHPSVVLYFYPKDDTPGCTVEACNFRDNMNRLAGLGAKVLGVSPDSVESHQKFIAKHGLNFDLLSDPDHQLASTMKVWKEKSFMGKKYMGIERSTFLFENGQLAMSWQPVKVEGHVDDVLAAIQETGSDSDSGAPIA